MGLLHKLKLIKIFIVIYLLIICTGSSSKIKEVNIHHLIKRKLPMKSVRYDSFCTHVLTGVLDRFEKDLAVILLKEKNEEVIICKNKLPKGSVENTWFRIKSYNNTYHILSIDQEKTQFETKKSFELLTKLRKK